MSQAMLLRQSLLQKVELFHRYLHDTGLLSALMLSLVLATTVAGTYGSLGAIASQLSEKIQATADGNTSAAVPLDKKISPKPLSREMHASLDFVARKFRVSAEALKPAFVAAQSAAEKNGIDPLLVIAVICVESRFNPYAESVAGAQGMQVMSRWHQEKIPDELGATALFDPETNVRVGVQILHESIRAGGGVIDGLQHFAGASDDPELGYANKVLSQKRELESAVGRVRSGKTMAMQ